MFNEARQKYQITIQFHEPNDRLLLDLALKVFFIDVECGVVLIYKLTFNKQKKTNRWKQTHSTESF